MLFTMLINLATYILNGIISVFPTSVGFPSGVHDAIIGLGSYLMILDPLVPIVTLTSAVTLVVSVELGIYGFRSLKWVISHLPVIGGKG